MLYQLLVREHYTDAVCTIHEANNKKKVRELAAKVADIRDEMADPSFSMMNRHLETLIRYKTRKGDNKLPTKKAEMLQRWSETRDQGTTIAPRQPIQFWRGI